MIVSAKSLTSVDLNVSAEEGAYFLCDNTYYLNKISSYFGGNNNIDKCIISQVKIKRGAETDEEGALIRFEDSGGYMIIGPRYEVYGFDFLNTKEINPIIYNFDEYDIYSGFSFNTKKEDNAWMTESFNTAVINGGTNSSGVIINKDVYISETYGTGYNLDSFESLSSRLGATQGALSVYEEVYDVDNDGIVDYSSSEGNCATVAVYNYMKFLKYDRSTRYTNLPYGIASFAYDPEIEEYDLYQEMLLESNYWIFDGNVYYGVLKPIKNFTFLYADTRQEAIDINGYPWGLDVWQTRDLINNLLENNNYYNSNHSVIEFPSSTKAINTINNGDAFILSLLWDNVYGTHEVFVSGYYTYYWLETFLFFKFHHYKYLLEIRDGWGDDIRYYDMSNSDRAFKKAFITMD